MKNRILTLAFLITFSGLIFAQDLPVLVDTIDAPCGGHMDYSHQPNGSPDAIGFILVSGINTCLPKQIHLRHYAYTVKDRIEVYFQDVNGNWHIWYDSGWHSKMRQKDLTIPDWTIAVMFVGSNNLDSGTEWWLELDCEYPPLEECCRVVVELSGPTDTFCPDALIKVYAQVTSGNPPYEYFWNHSNIVNDSMHTSYAGQSFLVKVVDSIGCEGYAYFRANVRKSPIAIPALLVCPNSWVMVPKILGLTWQFTDTLVFVQKDTILWGITSDMFGCEYNVPLRVNSQRPPVVSRDTVICRNRFVHLQTSGKTCSWQNSYGNELSDQKIFVVKPNTDSSFFLVVTDSLGCVWKDTVNIDTRYCLDDVNLYAPNVILPEGSIDPTNSIWKIFIDPKTLGDIQVVNLRIWDRWGNLVHQAKNLEIVWDGTYANGTPASSGVYIWEAYLETHEGGFTFAGDITVVR